MIHLKINIPESGECIIPLDRVLIYRNTGPYHKYFYFGIQGHPNFEQKITKEEYERIRKILIGD